MFVIDDEIHCELQEGRFVSFAEAYEEVRLRSLIPWNEAPNVAPCTSWRTCGRVYEIVEYDDSFKPWLELQRVPIFKISAAGVKWLRVINQKI